MKRTCLGGALEEVSSSSHLPIPTAEMLIDYSYIYVYRKR